MITRKSDGDPEPCFTPRLIGNEADIMILYFTRLVGDWYQALMRHHDLPLMPIENKWCREQKILPNQRYKTKERVFPLANIVKQHFLSTENSYSTGYIYLIGCLVYIWEPNFIQSQ